jgi:hypothetical protein
MQRRPSSVAMPGGWPLMRCRGPKRRCRQRSASGLAGWRATGEVCAGSAGDNVCGGARQQGRDAPLPAAWRAESPRLCSGLALALSIGRKTSRPTHPLEFDRVDTPLRWVGLQAVGVFESGTTRGGVCSAPLGAGSPGLGGAARGGRFKASPSLRFCTLLFLLECQCFHEVQYCKRACRWWRSGSSSESHTVSA